NDDFVSCSITSDAPCVTTPDTVSNVIYMIGLTTGVNSVSLQQSKIVVYPNPNDGTFHLTGTLANNDVLEINVVNLLGQVIYKDNITPQNSRINTTISLPGGMPNGLYILRLQNENDI